MHYDYVQYNRRIFAVLLVIIVVAIFTLEVSAATTTAEIELTTRSILLVDRSGSMKDLEAVEKKMSEVDALQYDAVVYFDARDFTQNPEYVGMGNSPICEAVNSAAEGGFTHITVVTDGEQWPEDYSSLGIYTDRYVTILLTEEKDDQSQKFIEELADHLTKSTLKVVDHSGEEILMDEYQPPRYVVEIEIPDPQPIIEETVDDEPIAETIDEVAGDDEEPIEETTGDVEGDDDEPIAEIIDEVIGDDDANRCLWWIALLLAVLIAAIFDFIHELITRGRSGYIGITKVLKSGGNALLDISGSMNSYQEAVLKAAKKGNAKKGNAKKIIAFAEATRQVSLKSVPSLNLGKTTHGWEALEMAASQGWDKIVLISDLEFNGKLFEAAKFQQNFKKITAVVPKGYCSDTVQKLQKIADEVEVLYL